MMPMPPARAMAMAMLDSVTVSMLALTTGICSRIWRESRAPTSTCRRERMLVRCGTSKTSSYDRESGISLTIAWAPDSDSAGMTPDRRPAPSQLQLLEPLPIDNNLFNHLNTDAKLEFLELI